MLPCAFAGSYTRCQTTMVVVDRDTQKMAKIWRIVKGFPHLGEFSDKPGGLGLNVCDFATKSGQFWPNRAGMTANDKEPRDARLFLRFAVIRQRAAIARGFEAATAFASGLRRVAQGRVTC
jgi:hypothetical protein